VAVPTPNSHAKLSAGNEKDTKSAPAADSEAEDKNATNESPVKPNGPAASSDTDGKLPANEKDAVGQVTPVKQDAPDAPPTNPDGDVGLVLPTNGDADPDQVTPVKRNKHAASPTADLELPANTIDSQAKAPATVTPESSPVATDNSSTTAPESNDTNLNGEVAAMGQDVPATDLQQGLKPSAKKTVEEAKTPSQSKILPTVGPESTQAEDTNSLSPPTASASNELNSNQNGALPASMGRKRANRPAPIARRRGRRRIIVCGSCEKKIGPDDVSFWVIQAGETVQIQFKEHVICLRCHPIVPRQDGRAIPPTLPEDATDESVYRLFSKHEYIRYCPGYVRPCS
jgi:hypothetical protein